MQIADTGTYPAQDSTVDLGVGRYHVIGNRVIGGRSIQGIIYYGALYSSALTAEEVTQNVAQLLASDDRP